MNAYDEHMLESPIGEYFDQTGRDVCNCETPVPGSGTPELGQKCLNCGGVI